MTWTRITAAVVVLVLGGGCAAPSRVEPRSVAGEKPGYSDATDTPLEGDGERCSSNCAPDFSVTTFTRERFALADHRGKVVVLNFWESW